MADADWHRYKQLRGKALPDEFAHQGVRYRRHALLKRDFYAAVGIYETDTPTATAPPQVLLKVYHTDPLWGVPFGWLGRWLARREIRAYEALAGVAGVPRLLARFGDAGMVREFVPGCNLKEYRATNLPDASFYQELAAILAAVHARGMSHNDLAKPENVVVDAAGRPILIDFQIALGPRVRWPLRRFLRYMQAVDRYHVRKHHTHDRPDDFTEVELRQARKKGTILYLHGVVVRKPYRAVRHFVLRRFLMNDGQRPAA